MRGALPFVGIIKEIRFGLKLLSDNPTVLKKSRPKAVYASIIQYKMWWNDVPNNRK